MNVSFTEDGWRDFHSWLNEDKKTQKRIHELIADTQRNGYGGIGHPEMLRGNLSGWCSKAIDEKNRLVFKIEGGSILILQCRGHYDDH